MSFDKKNCEVREKQVQNGFDKKEKYFSKTWMTERTTEEKRNKPKQLMEENNKRTHTMKPANEKGYVEKQNKINSNFRNQSNK